MSQYFEAEVERPDLADVTRKCLENLKRRPDLQSLLGSDAFGLECAWRLYSLGTALFVWDKTRGVDAAQFYREERRSLLQREWSGPSAIPADQPVPARRDTPTAAACPAPWIGPVWQPAQEVTGEEQMLLALRGRPICRLVQTLYQVGAHRFQEKTLFFELFPNLQRICLFEPLPDLFALLRQQEASDPRVTVLPYAISDRNGEALFNVASNDAASSSLLNFGRVGELFPEVRMTGQITVQTRTLDTAMAEHQLPPPDLIFLDVQGAEYQVLASLSASLRRRLRLIYTEASLEEVYAGAKTLDELKKLLAPEFLFLGYCPLRSQIRFHGNALFIHESQSWLLPPMEPPAPVAVPEASSRIKHSAWARALRRLLPWKLRRSIRKRLATLSQALTD